MPSLTRGAFLLLMLQVLLTVAFVSKSSSKPEITNFLQTDQTLSTVTVEWDIDTSTYVPLIYVITVEDLLIGSSTDFRFQCLVPHCSYTVVDLSPCTQYHLHVVATFDDGTSNSGADLRQARTEFEVPKEVRDLIATNDTVSWSAPTNENCVDHYQVCYTSFVIGVQQCFETTRFAFSLQYFTACDKVEVIVRAVSGDGKNGPTSAVDASIPYADPSEPTNVCATTLSDVAIKIVWDAPALNPACIYHDTYRIKFGEIIDNSVEQRVQYSNKGICSSNDQEFTAILTPLKPCTNYSFSITGSTITNQNTEPAYDSAATEYSAPAQVPDVVVVGGDGKITVQWGDVVDMVCLDTIWICDTDTETHQQVCHQVPDKDSGSYIIEGLQNSRTYSIVIVGVSGIGQLGEKITVAVDTNDAVPGSVRNLKIDSTTTNTTTISYDEPEIN